MTAVETKLAAATPAMEEHGVERRVLAIRLVTILFLVVAWEALSHSGLFYEGVLPSIVLIASALIYLLTDPVFYRHLAVSGTEILAGLAIGAALGVPLGILFGSRRFLGRVVAP